MAFAYREATIIDLQEGDAVSSDVHLLTYVDNVVLNLINLVVQNLEVLIEADNVILQIVAAGGMGNFFAVM